MYIICQSSAAPHLLFLSIIVESFLFQFTSLFFFPSRNTQASTFYTHKSDASPTFSFIFPVLVLLIIFLSFLSLPRLLQAASTSCSPSSVSLPVCEFASSVTAVITLICGWTFTLTPLKEQLVGKAWLTAGGMDDNSPAHASAF